MPDQYRTHKSKDSLTLPSIKEQNVNIDDIIDNHSMPSSLGSPRDNIVLVIDDESDSTGMINLVCFNIFSILIIFLKYMYVNINFNIIFNIVRLESYEESSDPPPPPGKSSLFMLSLGYF